MRGSLSTERLKGLLRADLQQHKLNPAKFVALFGGGI